MNKANFEADLQQKIEQLDKSQQPQRDLWSGIELALAEQEQEEPESDKGLVKLGGMAAAVAFVGLLSWQMYTPEKVGVEDIVTAMSEQHAQQKQTLLVSFQGQVAMTQNWEDQLGELDDAANAIKQVLKEQPNNVALLKMLQNVHQQQIDLIERVHTPKWSQI